MATKRKEPESQRISWFLYSFELPLLSALFCHWSRDKRNADKGLSDGLERIGGKPREFHGAVDRTAAE